MNFDASIKASRLSAESHPKIASGSRVPLKPVYWMLSPNPGPDARRGPLFLRGTIRVLAGIRLLAGTTVKSSRIPFPRLLLLNVSGIAITFSSCPRYTVLSPLGELESGRTSST